MWVPTMSYCPARVMMEKWDVKKSRKKPIGERRTRPKKWCVRGGGVMVIKYTMSRGLYGGCGGGERGKEMDGDERHGKRSIVPPRSLHASRSCDLVKQQMFLLSQHERRGQEIDKNESVESKKKRDRGCGWSKSI